MANENEWVRSFQPRLSNDLADSHKTGWNVRVDPGKKLTYAHEILQYNAEEPDRQNVHVAKYETDLLIYDEQDDTRAWIPRVVVECKKGSVTTHDALTYSAKAETHKRVHPYVRYGILVGDFDNAIPGRLIRHGAYFDFMMVWASADATPDEWNDFIELIQQEITASREMESLLMERRHAKRTRLRLLHRPLRLKRL